MRADPHPPRKGRTARTLASAYIACMTGAGASSLAAREPWRARRCGAGLGTSPIAVTVSSTSWRSNASLVKPAGSIKPTLSPGRSRGGFRRDEGAAAVTWDGNANVTASAPKLWMAVRLLSIRKDKIGRAWCRDGVGQYVYISGVAG